MDRYEELLAREYEQALTLGMTTEQRAELHRYAAKSAPRIRWPKTGNPTDWEAVHRTITEL